MKGAASFGVNPAVIRARCSRLTYGVSLTPTFIPEFHPESKKFWAEDLNEYLCMDWFGTLVRVGQRVPVDAEITTEFQPTDRNQKGMNFAFFSTPKEDVYYTDESDVTTLGELLVEMPFTTGGLDRRVEVTFYFGQTEIRVKAIDKTSGNEYKTSIRFSSGY
ncbi:hypothetical protein [Okeania sp. SIO1I7]|uniref:hypothetical protein n=1 Tax=Okeania sp. SIO1I7 TaxID=2607772 RepID=UPI0013F6AB8E|nr:hypothetical protein [Okeania sp. SIO1I7]NET24568.1 hypothetical protein [Okeania sp. SIO1I7]